MDGRDFLGIGLKFPLQVDPRTGKIALSRGEEDIQESIGIILNTLQGERVMRPDFGTNVLDYTFAPASSSTRHALAKEVEEALLYQEPRITDVDVVCQDSDRLTGSIVMSVSYTVRSTNSRYNHVYPFYVIEGSEGGGGE